VLRPDNRSGVLAAKKAAEEAAAGSPMPMNAMVPRIQTGAN
jgi:hypothetical protein